MTSSYWKNLKEFMMLLKEKLLRLGRMLLNSEITRRVRKKYIFKCNYYFLLDKSDVFTFPKYTEVTLKSLLPCTQTFLQAGKQTKNEHSQESAADPLGDTGGCTCTQTWLCPHSSEMGKVLQRKGGSQEGQPGSGGVPRFVLLAQVTHVTQVTLISGCSKSLPLRAHWNCSQCRNTLCPVNSLFKQHLSFSPEHWAHEQGGKAWDRSHSTCCAQTSCLCTPRNTQGCT